MTKRRAKPEDIQIGHTVYERTWTHTGAPRWTRGWIKTTDGWKAWVRFPCGRESLLPFAALWVETSRALARERRSLREELHTLTALRDSIDIARRKRIAELEDKLRDERKALRDDWAHMKSVIAKLAALNAGTD